MQHDVSLSIDEQDQDESIFGFSCCSCACAEKIVEIKAKEAKEKNRAILIRFNFGRFFRLFVVRPKMLPLFTLLVIIPLSLSVTPSILNSYIGTTPLLDGILDLTEWSDATLFGTNISLFDAQFDPGSFVCRPFRFERSCRVPVCGLVGNDGRGSQGHSG